MGNSELIKRDGIEAEIEASMRRWFDMKTERDEAQRRIAELEVDLIKSQTENAVLLDRNKDLEEKYETLLITNTQITSALTSVGGLGDAISVTVSQILALSRTSSRNQELQRTVRNPEGPRSDSDSSRPSPTTSKDISEALQNVERALGLKDEDQALRDLADKLSPQPDPTQPPNFLKK